MRRETDLVTANGKVPTYDAIRQFILDRDPVCCICGRAPSTEVDHIWPRYHGGDDMAANLQGACGPCNKAKGNYIDTATATPSQLHAAMQAACKRIDQARRDAAGFGLALTWCSADGWRWALGSGLTSMQYQSALIETSREIVGDKYRRRMDLEDLAENERAAELSEVSP